MVVIKFLELILSPYSLRKIGGSDLLTNYKVLNFMQSALIVINIQVIGKEVYKAQRTLLIFYYVSFFIDILRYVLNLMVLTPDDSVNFCDPGIFFESSRLPVDFLVLAFRITLWIFVSIKLVKKLNLKKRAWFDIFLNGNLYETEFKHSHEKEWSKLRQRIGILHKFAYFSYLFATQTIVVPISISCTLLFNSSRHNIVMVVSSCFFGFSQLYLTVIEGFGFCFVFCGYIIASTHRLEVIKQKCSNFLTEISKDSSISDPTKLVTQYVGLYIDVEFFNQCFQFILGVGVLCGIAISLNAFYVGLVAKSPLLMRVSFIYIVLIAICLTIGIWCFLGELAKIKNQEVCSYLRKIMLKMRGLPRAQLLMSDFLLSFEIHPLVFKHSNDYLLDFRTFLLSMLEIFALMMLLAANFRTTD